MREISIYITAQAWLDDKPEAVIKGSVYVNNNGNYIEIKDENGYTQIISLDKVFAVVY